MHNGTTITTWPTYEGVKYLWQVANHRSVFAPLYDDSLPSAPKLFSLLSESVRLMSATGEFAEVAL